MDIGTAYMLAMQGCHWLCSGHSHKVFDRLLGWCILYYALHCSQDGLMNE